MSRSRLPMPGRALTVVALAATAVLALGTLLVRSGGSTGEGRPSADVDDRAPVEPDSEDRTGRFSQDEAGAVSAAIASVGAAQRWFYMGDDELVAAISAITTNEARDRLVEQNLAAVRLARESFASAAGRIWWVVRPLAWRVEVSTTERMQVAIWTVTVLSAAGVAVPQATWSTVQVDLIWGDRAWLVDDMVDVPGPTPMTGPQDDPWDAAPFDAALAGFTRLETEPIP